ncbi:hypothetical protein LDL36_19345 [Komagataeibacter sp. FNDCR1]|nr:hypothetical protein [Komagataeibacter sp. FNDCR1]
MSALSQLLDTYRNLSVTEREKGTYFEELIVCYLRTEPSYADLYDQVWTYKDWATEEGYVAKDTGIDLVARTRGTGEYHAIQCKFYASSQALLRKYGEGDSLSETSLLAGCDEQAETHGLPNDELVLLQRSAEEAWISDGVV